MDDVIRSFIGRFRLGEGQSNGNMAVFPILMPENGGPEYMTMKEALEKALLTVTEVSAGGSVPDLRVKNRAGIPVLFLDGKELAGAKQSRVLNTTILVDAGAELVVPVSCTERGRWSYDSREFRESRHMLPQNIRRRSMPALVESLESSRGFRSDQGMVWEEIDVAFDVGGVIP